MDCPNTTGRGAMHSPSHIVGGEKDVHYALAMPVKKG